jgi:quinol monooxygenase YgiN
MAHTLTRLKIGDFQQWLDVFNSNSGMRAQFGAQGGHAFVNADDPGEVLILMAWQDDAHARAFTTSPELRAAMQNAGIQGPPQITYLEEVYDATP